MKPNVAILVTGGTMVAKPAGGVGAACPAHGRIARCHGGAGIPIRAIAGNSADLPNIGKDQPRVISYGQVPLIEVETEQQDPISRDGEKLITKSFRVEVLKRRLTFLRPEEAT